MTLARRVATAPARAWACRPSRPSTGLAGASLTLAAFCHPAATEEAQLWSSIREQLRQLDVLRDEIKPLEEEYEQLQAWPSAAVPHRRSLEDVSNELQARLQRAHSLSDNAYEKVSILQALLASAAPGDVPLRKRRRVETSPVASGSAVSRLASPASPLPTSYGSDRSSEASAWRARALRKPLATTPGSAETVASPPPPAPVSAPAAVSASTPGNDPARTRREQYGAQLPLYPGRKVAFRPPLGRGEPGPKDDCEGWIMATVVECINNDRNRYVVRDADMETEYVAVPAVSVETQRTDVHTTGRHTIRLSRLSFRCRNQL